MSDLSVTNLARDRGCIISLTKDDVWDIEDTQTKSVLVISHADIFDEPLNLRIAYSHQYEGSKGTS